MLGWWKGIVLKRSCSAFLECVFWSVLVGRGCLLTTAVTRCSLTSRQACAYSHSTSATVQGAAPCEGSESATGRQMRTPAKGLRGIAPCEGSESCRGKITDTTRAKVSEA